MNNLAKLTEQWLEAKAAEVKANLTRVAIEALIAAELPAQGPETTHMMPVGDYRVSVRYGVRRKVDTERLQAIWGDLLPVAQSVFKWKADVTLPKLRALQEMIPAQYAKIAVVIEAKPAKPSVSVEAIEKEAA